jgi:hypothetical protein
MKLSLTHQGKVVQIALSAEGIKSKMEQLLEDSVLGEGRTAYNGLPIKF